MPEEPYVRIAVCEDEKIYQNIILTLLKRWADNTDKEIDIAAFDSAEELLMLWGDVIFDVLILDIEMKKMSGMELAKAIRRNDDDVIIIFVTCHESYSLEGYDVNPLHFLLKPLDEKIFYKVLDKAFAIYQLMGGDGFIIHSDDGLEKISADKIRYLSMASHKAEIYTADGTYVTRLTVNELLRTLPAHFVKCHRSYVVNIFKVTCVFDDHMVIADDVKIPISRNHIKRVREFFMRLQTR
jgi:DNA-binding LytR/AlgR family response regulator